MATIERFEDIEAWQNARKLVITIYQASIDGAFSKDFAFRDQIRRAAVSIMSNIAEGFGRSGNREFIQFLSVAKGSVSEVQSQLYIALDVGYIDRKQFDGEYIELLKLLKITGLCSTGGMAKNVADEGRVTVDNRVEYRKRCKIRKGQIVAFEGNVVEVE